MPQKRDEKRRREQVTSISLGEQSLREEGGNKDQLAGILAGLRAQLAKLDRV